MGIKKLRRNYFAFSVEEYVVNLLQGHEQTMTRNLVINFIPSSSTLDITCNAKSVLLYLLVDLVLIKY